MGYYFKIIDNTSLYPSVSPHITISDMICGFQGRGFNARDAVSVEKTISTDFMKFTLSDDGYKIGDIDHLDEFVNHSDLVFEDFIDWDLFSEYRNFNYHTDKHNLILYDIRRLSCQHMTNRLYSNEIIEERCSPTHFPQFLNRTEDRLYRAVL